MPHKIEYAGQVHEFPDDFTDDEIRAALEAQPETPKPPAAALDPKGAWAQNPGGPVSRLLTGIGEFINPVPAVREFLERPNQWKAASEGASAALASRNRTPSADEQAAINRGFKANIAAPFSPSMPMGAEAIPMAVNRARAGDVAGAAGNVIGAYGVPAAVSAGLSRIPSVRVPGTPRVRLKPREAEAVAFLQSQGVPLDLATLTGNRAVRNARAYTQNVPFGAGYAEDAMGATTAAMEKTGERLAGQVSSTPASPVQAGQAVRDALDNRISRLHGRATQAYDQLRQVEADPTNLRTVQIGVEIPSTINAELDALSMSLAGKPFSKLASEYQQQAILRTAQSAGIDISPKPIMREVALPVDMRPVKEALGPIYERLKRQMPIAKQRMSDGMKAFENIMGADDFLPASQADADLSAIKAAARGADLPELRSLSQGLAAKAVEEFDTAVRQGVSAGGPQASQALERGRLMTRAKYETADVLKKLRSEPVQLFEQFTYARDSGINLAREVRKLSPGEVSGVARAYVEGLLETLNQGDWQNARTVLSQWRKLGPQTKNTLFSSPALVHDLDSFFQGAEMIAKNPNPSGTSYVASLAASIAGIPSTVGLYIVDPWAGAAATATGGGWLITNAALARLLFNPKASRAISQGLRIPVGNKAAAAVAASQIVNIAGKDAQRIEQ